MKCNLCIEKEKNWDKSNSPIECAFDNKQKTFSSNNWNCWTLEKLRDYFLDTDITIWNQDQNAGLIPYEIEEKGNYEIGYLFLEWYKSRWETEKLLICNSPKEKVKLEYIEKIILTLK